MIWRFDYSKQPSPGKNVLVYDGNNYAIGYLTDDRKTWTIVTGPDISNQIIAWCRIPTPPVMEEYLLYKKVQSRGMDEIITRQYK